MTDDDPGPLIRLYGLTGGRARPQGEAFDLVAIVATVHLPQEPSVLNPEHHTILRICRRPTPRGRCRGRARPAAQRHPRAAR
ncbi:DUF742 domain-containing protein [Nonomuraea ferruginea]